MEKTYKILYQNYREVNTDPQRRCYDGCHFSSEWVWGPWIELETVTETEAQKRLAFWQGLNDYAVKARGKSARCNYKIVEA